jgi:membrane protease YdiL (CAAX protease family)
MTESVPPVPEKQNTLRNVLTVIIGIVPIYAYLMWSHITRGGIYTLSEMLFYPIVIGSGWSIVLLLLYRYMCKKRVSQLNRMPGKWWKDILMGIALGAGLLILFFIQQNLNPLFPQKPPSRAIINLLTGLVRSPLLIAVWLGPVVWIGVAFFEELQRVFMLDLLWDTSDSVSVRWAVILLSAVLFALAHIYQGPANMIGIFIAGVIYGYFYLKNGRIWPMIIAHGLYDSLQVAIAVIEISRAMG